MYVTTDQYTASDFAHLRLAELAALRIWGELYGLEVTIEAADFGYSGEMAFIGFGGGNACWSVYWINGQLWLAYLPFPSRECFEGWAVQVRSVVEAMALVIADTEG